MFVMLEVLSGFVSVYICVVQTGNSRLRELNADASPLVWVYLRRNDFYI
jgi:hypothetical protein